MIRRLLRRGIRIGAVVGAILFLVQIFLRNPRPKHQDSATPAPRPAPTPPVAAKPVAAKPKPAPVAATPAPAAATAAPAPAPAATNDAAQAWVDPVDGACPTDYPVKVKLASGIFHVPGGLAYDRTTPDRCYRDAATAEADGFRQSKR